MDALTLDLAKKYTDSLYKSLIDSGWGYTIKSALPTSGINTKKIYLISKSGDLTNATSFDAYVWNIDENKWIKLGSPSIDLDNAVDLTDYAKKEDVEGFGAQIDANQKSIESLKINKADKTYVDNKTAFCLGVSGLYSENNELIKSWDKLIADGDITVSDNIITGNNLSTSGKLIIDDSVTNIGDRAFENCTSLTSVTIGNSVTSIGSSAFSSCKSLTNITFGDSVTSIDDYAFWLCKSLTSITIPDSVTRIRNDAFEGCTSLKSINIPDGITSIDGYTFRNCTSLKSITIPNSVTNIGSSTFYSCTSLTDVYYKGTKSDFSKIEIASDNDNFKNATIHYELTDEVYDEIDKKADKTYVDSLMSAVDKVITEVQPCKPILVDTNTTLNNMSLVYDSKTCTMTLDTGGEALSATSYFYLDLSLFESGKTYGLCYEKIDGEIGQIYFRAKVNGTETPLIFNDKSNIRTFTVDETLTSIRLQFQKENFTGSIRFYVVEGDAFQSYQDKYYNIKDEVTFQRLENEFADFKNNEFMSLNNSVKFATQKAYFNPFDSGFLRISYNGTKFAPPNTVIGVKTSSFLGYRAIKGDVRKCADGYVMCHDTTINQTTTGSGTIINMTVEQIKTYPLKSQINGFSENVYIDTFEDWLLACKCNKITPFINFKDDLSAEQFSSEAEDCLAIIERLGMIDKCVIQAFDFENLEKIRSLNDKVMMMKVLYQGNVFRLTGAAKFPQHINALKPCGVILFDNNTNTTLLRGDDTVGGADDYKNHAKTHYFDDFNLINDETLSYCRENNIPIEVAICYSFEMDKVVQNAGFDGVMTNASYDLPRSKKIINIDVSVIDGVVSFSTLDGEVTAVLNEDGSYKFSVDSITPNMIYWFKPKIESDICTVAVNSNSFVVSDVTESGTIRIEI